MPGPDSLDNERRLEDAGWQRAEARAVFLSIVALLAGESVLDECVDVLEVACTLDTGLDPDGIDWMRWDGNFLWTACAFCPETDVPIEQTARPTGRSVESLYSRGERGRGPGLPAVGDRHTLEIHEGSRWQLWLLERGATGWISRLLIRGD